MIFSDSVCTLSGSVFFSGCMICLGRSNYFRFNHPQEAALIRSVLPENNRLSQPPIGFIPGRWKENEESAPGEGLVPCILMTVPG